MYFKRIFCLFWIPFHVCAVLTVSSLGLLPNERYAPVLAAVASATSTLDVVMYDFSDPIMIQALIGAKQRGVTVRVMLSERVVPFPGLPDANPTTKATLEAAGIAVRYGNPAFIFTHEKTMIIDSATGFPAAFVMTLNFSPLTFQASRDFSIKVTTSAAVQEIQTGFNADWDRTTFTPTEADLVWAPNNALTKLTALIDSAQYTIDMYMELLGNPTITQAFLNAQARGVTVRMLLSPPINPDAFGQYYDFVVWSGTYNSAPVMQLEAGNIQFRFPTLPYIHAKVIVVDRGRASQRAFLGSENLYTGSLTQNRELGVLIDDASIIAQLVSVFVYDWEITRGF
ncbi:MAG: hypothetical protein RL235_879 [Chlamydiota bacterium]|jgi:phosphatidylserine/phosphatidylglycerophosphate/cardiolipin synthase-like enzyme